MARPDILKLQHDKSLTKANYPTFVETWNYSVNRLENIKGDGDIDGREGFIKLDNIKPEFPIIRFDYNNLRKKLDDSLGKTDSEVDQLGLSSIQRKYYEIVVSSYNEAGEIEWDTKHAYATSMFDFDNNENQIDTEDMQLSDYDIVLRHRMDENVNVLEYMCLSSLSSEAISGDVNVLEDRKSIETKAETKDDKKLKYHQLYKFDDEDYCDSTTLTAAHDEQSQFIGGSGCEGHIVVRQYDGDTPILKYANLSIELDHEDTDSTMTDKGLMSPQLWSINYDEETQDKLNGNGQKTTKYLQLYNFGCLGILHTVDKSQLSNDDDEQDSFVVRKWTGNGKDHRVDYYGFDIISSLADYKGDSNLTSLDPRMYSITRETSDTDGWYYQLYNWTGGHTNLNVTPEFNGCAYDWGNYVKDDELGEGGEEYLYLQQHIKSNGERELVYRKLVVTMPKLSDDYVNKETITEIEKEIEGISSVIENLSSDISGNYWKLGGDLKECYGSAIGNNSGITVMSLDTKTLFHDWSSYNFTVRNNLTINSLTYGCNWQIGSSGCALFYKILGNSPSESEFRIKLTFMNGCGFTTDGQFNVGNTTVTTQGLTIGCTTLTEAKLIKLLSLVEGDSTAADKVNLL